MIKIASLFSGIGGFEKGILQAISGANIVFSSEIDKYARQIYKKNFGVEPHGDITKIKASNIPDHDILCGGFPCQAFSIAGKRRGFEDTRGTLFFEIMRIAKVKRPKLLYFENVRGLLSHDEGRTFQTILRSMDDLGYDAEWQVFNSKNHGVPQNRERVFIIGHLRGAGTRKIFPITSSSRQGENELGLQGTQQIACALRATDYKGTHNNVREITCCLDANYYKGIDCHQQRSGVVTENEQIRRLMPIECERLQGFPDNWTAEGIDENGNIVKISDTQRYKCLGNAVTTTVIQFISKTLICNGNI